MKKSCFVFICCIMISLMACKATRDIDPDSNSLEETLREKNRNNISLLTRIRQLPGVILRRGVPVFTKNQSSITTNGTTYEPLYVLNDYVVGNSFVSVNQLVTNINVKKIEALKGHEASFYGTRGANGVIKITTD